MDRLGRQDRFHGRDIGVGKSLVEGTEYVAQLCARACAVICAEKVR